MAPGPLDPALVTVLEHCHISPCPAPAADQPRALPLTFFDLVFWDFPPVQRLFFYANADLRGGHDFQVNELPRLKKSLAAALHHFYPLAGKLSCELTKLAPPEVVFEDGDSVRVTVAVSGDDFNDLAGDHARDTTRLRALLPSLPKHGGGVGSCRQGDVFAVQVTVFPGAGVCLGTTLHHAVADGSSYVHFMKTWAAIHRLGPAESMKAVVGLQPPLLDRGVVRDDAGLREAFVRDHRDLAAAGDARLGDWDMSRRPGVVLATFRFTEKQLARLGRRVETQTSARRCSPYALACGAAWAGILHARSGGGSTNASSPEADAPCFGFVTGCKPRVNPPIPANYFGNCLGLCRVELEPITTTKRESGLFSAASASAAIWRVIEGLAEEGRALRDARGWVRTVREYASRRAVTVAGSPKLGVYDVDFGGEGWGRPTKVEIVSVERTGALALAESGRDGDGGIELGLALPRAEMEAFRSFYQDLFAGSDVTTG